MFQVSMLVGGSLTPAVVRSCVLLNKCDDLSAIYHLLASNSQQQVTCVFYWVFTS